MCNGSRSKATVRAVDEPAPTILAASDNDGCLWVYDRPATTVMGTPRIFPADGHHPEMGMGHASGRAVKVTLDELATLQGFPLFTEVHDMTRDELCACALAAGHLTVDTEEGTVYRHRGPGGLRLTKPEVVEGTNLKGYRVMTLKCEGARRQVRLHRLVWIAANGLPAEGMTVDHINGIKHDNRLANLRLVTGPENSRLAHHEQGLYNYERKLTGEQYKLICADRATTDLTIQQIADKYGVSHGRIKQILRSDGYPFQGNKTSRARQIGDAVPPKMAEVLVRAAAQHLQERAVS